jgi:hypothetical protein
MSVSYCSLIHWSDVPLDASDLVYLRSSVMTVRLVLHLQVSMAVLLQVR